jgi:hypothetical protein
MTKIVRKTDKKRKKRAQESISGTVKKDFSIV